MSEKILALQNLLTFFEKSLEQIGIDIFEQLGYKIGEDAVLKSFEERKKNTTEIPGCKLYDSGYAGCPGEKFMVTGINVEKFSENEYKMELMGKFYTKKSILTKWEPGEIVTIYVKVPELTSLRINA